MPCQGVRRAFLRLSEQTWYSMSGQKLKMCCTQYTVHEYDFLSKHTHRMLLSAKRSAKQTKSETEWRLELENGARALRALFSPSREPQTVQLAPVSCLKLGSDKHID